MIDLNPSEGKGYDDFSSFPGWQMSTAFSDVLIEACPASQITIKSRLFLLNNHIIHYCYI